MAFDQDGDHGLLVGEYLVERTDADAGAATCQRALEIESGETLYP